MKFNSSDRQALICLAGTLPKGSAERRTILSGLKTSGSLLKGALASLREAGLWSLYDSVVEDQYDGGYILGISKDGKTKWLADSFGGEFITDRQFDSAEVKVFDRKPSDREVVEMLKLWFGSKYPR